MNKGCNARTGRIAKTGMQPMTDRHVILKTDETAFMIEAAIGARPRILYWGPALGHASADEIALLSVRQWAHGGPAVDISPSLSNELGGGASSPSGFIAHRERRDWAAIFKVTDIIRDGSHAVAIICEDPNTAMRARYDIALNPVSHVLTAETSITNLGAAPVAIDWCASLCMPLNTRLTRLTGFTGRWAMEFQRQEVPAFHGGYIRENRSGRTSHDAFPGMIALTDWTNETSGAAAGFHLGWSGNSRVRADRCADGRAFVQMGELFYPGEMELAAGETYTTPTLFAAWSDNGLNRLSQQFHTHLTESVMDGRTAKKPRPIHYNTWEAVYFDHSEERLTALAEKAASVGAERFVLDDGWFGARRSDAAGLGDWRASRDVYPNGLAPLADRVRALGMEFGLWFEPEMVNRNSDLFRAHPDWILNVDGVEQVPFRHQYALNLTLPEVSDYLFETISAVISECGVAYVKWDMNREIQHPGSAGRAVIHQQTKAAYALMKRLRDAHPELEIESCASGGARCDYGVLRYADRIWTSDSNDALDRQEIQRGASHFFPLCVTGTHVGPHECHITRRTLSMPFRAATAFFGHMGLELDLTRESEEDLGVLKEAVALHKKHRALIHGGDFVRLDAAGYLNAVGVVAKDKSEALFSCAKTGGHAAALPERLQFTGLAPEKRYRLRVIWPRENPSVTAPSIMEAADLMGEGSVFSGEALLVHGAQLPLMHPESCIIYHLTPA